ncbi:hypothetical protein GCM10017044_12280 [Kordiimonas sediminis]|uniref:YD repeat-containing protein n=1 Tax=Kordiimonas sediminis TaxID=1735581 RepID=A0A919AQG5_9PROT|nr:hypothetical protein [Kordiimonas sediminis]GHF19268.1 hypothetical protein GCM10017044_12280 [Kordiimonas sediminis]
MSKILLLSVVMSAAIWSTNASAEQEHFRHMMFRESPYAPYRGIYPMDGKDTEKAVHYEFSYDDEGRVTRISHKLDDQTVPLHGGFDTFIWFAPEVRIAYSDGQEVHTYYGTDGVQIHAHGQVWRAVYSLDADGNRTSLEFFDKDGAPSANAWNITRYEWRPSEDGHIFEKRFNPAGEQEKMRPVLEFYEVKLEYDRDGKLSFMRNYGLDHTPTNNSSGAGIDRITYDLNGNFIRWQVYDKDGNAVEGNRPMVHLGEHLYDDKGNKIGMRGFDRHGVRMPFSWGAIMEETSYNQQGVRIAFRSYRPDWSLDANFAFDYSKDLSRQLSIKSMDANGQLKDDPRLNGGAVLQFSQDDAGNIVRTFKRADGTPITSDDE